MRRIIRRSFMVLLAATSALWTAEGGAADEAGHRVVYTVAAFRSVPKLLELALQRVSVDVANLHQVLEAVGVPADLRNMLKDEPHRTIPKLVKTDPTIRKTMFDVLSNILQRSPVDKETQKAIEDWLNELLSKGLHSANASQTALLTDLVRTALDKSLLNKDTSEWHIILPLIYAGVDPETRDRQFNYTPLCFGAISGHKALVEALLAAGANINAKTISGTTPRGLALISGNREIQDLLIKAGANL